MYKDKVEQHIALTNANYISIPTRFDPYSHGLPQRDYCSKKIHVKNSEFNAFYSAHTSIYTTMVFLPLEDGVWDRDPIIQKFKKI